MLKNKIQLSQCNDLSDFVQWFLNRSKPHGANESSSEKRYKLKGFLGRQVRGGREEKKSKREEGIVSDQVIFPQGKAGSLIMQLILLVMLRKFQSGLKFYSWERLKLQLDQYFVLVGLHINESILGLFLFTNRCLYFFQTFTSIVSIFLDISTCDVVISNETCIFGLIHCLWHTIPKALVISYTGVIGTSFVKYLVFFLVSEIER